MQSSQESVFPEPLTLPLHNMFISLFQKYLFLHSYVRGLHTNTTVTSAPSTTITTAAK